MTRIDKRKSRLVFETSECVRERGRLREVIFEAENGYVMKVRLKGMRTGYEISPAGIYNLAVRVSVERARAERKKGRAGR
jgi:hypothetical protein